MLTDWFPPTVHPVRNGLYITKHSKYSDCWFVTYWNGSDWYAAECANAVKQDLMSIIGGRPNADRYYWRGLNSSS